MDFSISDLVKQNTLGQSEGFPVGVPKSYNWYKGWNDAGLHAPPADFTAVEGWGQVYSKVGAPTYSNPDATIEVGNAKTYVHIKQTGQWVLVQEQSKLQLTGGHFVSDFAGNAAIPMKVTPLADGRTAFDVPPTGYNNHFWYKSRGTYAAGTVDAVYVQMDMRVTDPNVKLVAMVGVDWWRDASAPYLDDHSNNPGVGGTNWVQLSTQWKTLGYYSMSTAEFQANLPPPLRGLRQSSPAVASSDTVAPAAPKITSFMPDTGRVGDRITSASVLTLTGTAEAGSTVKIFDGATQIGTVKANASGAWSFTTTELSNATHKFTATATNSAGNTSSASPRLNVKVKATGASPPSPTPSGGAPLVKGSFEATSEGGGERLGFSSNDGFDQTAVQAVAKQRYNFSFDAGSRSGPTGSTTTIELAWSDSFVLIPLIFAAIIKIRRNGSLDRSRKDSSSRQHPAHRRPVPQR
jgi:hypothetical protein